MKVLLDNILVIINPSNHTDITDISTDIIRPIKVCSNVEIWNQHYNLFNIDEDINVNTLLIYKSIIKISLTSALIIWVNN